MRLQENKDFGFYIELSGRVRGNNEDASDHNHNGIAYFDINGGDVTT